jgi:hypothetical protein
LNPAKITLFNFDKTPNSLILRFFGLEAHNGPILETNNLSILKTFEIPFLRPNVFPILESIEKLTLQVCGLPIFNFGQLSTQEVTKLLT